MALSGAAATAPNGPLHNPSAQPPVNPIVEAMSLEEQLDGLLEALQPCRQSEERRNAIFRFVQALLQSRFPFLECYLMGSFPLKTYLPDSDLDMTICASNATDTISDHQNQTYRGPSADNDLLVLVNEALCRAAVLGPISTTHRPGDAMEIRNISFVNARTKVVNCTVQNVAVDITVNQLGSLASLTFLEEVDRTIGGNHLFKRSILLIKAWCLHESSKYVGMAILGSKSHGGLSSYALSVMVLSLFNGSNGGLHHPLQVFGRFLQVFSSFDWSQHLLTHDGPIPLSCTYEPSSTGSSRDHRSRFGVLVEQLKRYSEEPGPSPSFPQRCCNILDPLNSSNNLGYSLNRQSLQYMQHALLEGRMHFEHVLGSNLLALPALVSAVSVASSHGRGSIDHAVVTPESALWADGGSTDSYSGSDDGNQSDSSSKSGHGILKPWSSTLPPPANYPVASKPNGGRGPSPVPGPTMAERASAALMSFFPRLYQLYASPNECRIDLLSHPCQSRTTMVCDDLRPGACPPASKSALLSGDITDFWKNLSSTCGNRSEKSSTTDESRKIDRSQSLWSSLTPKKLLQGHKEYDEEEYKCSDETAIANSRSTATSSPCSLSSLSSASSPQPHETDGKDLPDHHFEPTALDLPPPSSTVPSPASRPSVINPRSPHGDRLKGLDRYSLHAQSNAPSEGDLDHHKRRDPEHAQTATQAGQAGVRGGSMPVDADELHRTRLSLDKSKLQEAAAGIGPVEDVTGAGLQIASQPPAGAPIMSPCGKVTETKDVSCHVAEEEGEPLALPSAEEAELGVSMAARNASESAETGSRTKKCGSRRRKKGTSLVMGGSPDVTMVSIGIQTDSAPHPAKQQPPEPQRAPPPQQSSRGGKQKDKRNVQNRKPPCHQGREVPACLPEDKTLSSNTPLRRFHPRVIIGISSLLVLACIITWSLRGRFSSSHANQDPLSAAHLNESAATVAMASLPSSSSHGTTHSPKEETALPFWVVAGTILRLGDVPVSPRSRKVSRPTAGTTYRWFKDGELLEGSSARPYLVIQRVRPQDEGGYACYRVVVTHDKEGDAGMKERQELVGFTQVRVLQAPQLMTKRRIQTSLQPGSMLALYVAAEGVPEPEYQWRLNGVPIPGARSNTYTVRSVDASHMGTYTCEVWNLVGKVMWEEAVIAMAPPAPSS